MRWVELRRIGSLSIAKWASSAPFGSIPWVKWEKSAFDLAEIVESLTELSETKTLSPGDRHALDRARKLLVCEISEVMGETRGEAEQQMDRALKERKTE